DPLVHHGQYFGRAVHTFCNVQTLINNGLVLMTNDKDEETLTAVEQKECAIFRELLQMVPGIEPRLMDSSEEEVKAIADLVCFLNVSWIIN
ncbi:hypothetical protein OG21DRAFT_1428358, partial [Imleria badia]